MVPTVDYVSLAVEADSQDEGQVLNSITDRCNNVRLIILTMATLPMKPSTFERNPFSVE